MNPLLQRITIAEACGWKIDLKSCTFITPEKTYGHASPAQLPDYLNDLNAMHEAEAQVIIPRQLGQEYSVAINNVNEENQAYGDYHATAAQRAEAFLRTLNLWTDT